MSAPTVGPCLWGSSWAHRGHQALSGVAALRPPGPQALGMPAGSLQSNWQLDRQPGCLQASSPQRVAPCFSTRAPHPGGSSQEPGCSREGRSPSPASGVHPVPAGGASLTVTGPPHRRALCRAVVGGVLPSLPSWHSL